jgi:hypothetical protein
MHASFWVGAFHANIFGIFVALIRNIQPMTSVVPWITLFGVTPQLTLLARLYK